MGSVKFDTGRTWGSFKWGQFSGTLFVTEKNRHQTEGHLISRLYLDGRTLYLSDSYLSTAVYSTLTNDYEGLVLDWGSIDTDRPLTEGLASVGDTTITLANHRMQFMDEATYGERFSDLFDDYDFELRKWEILQWFEAINEVDAVAIFTGKVKIESFDADEIVIKVVQKSDDITLPFHLVNRVDNPDAPDENIGRPIPISFGDYRTDPDSYRGPFMPGIMTDRNKLRVDFAKGWELKEISGAGPYSYNIVRWIDELGVYLYLIDTNFTESSDDHFSYIEMLDPIYGTIVIVPKLAGTLNDVDNWNNAAKTVANTDTASLDGDNANDDELSLKFGSLPNLGKLQDWTNGNIRLDVQVDSITGGAGTAAVIDYFNEGYNDGTGAHSSTSQNITSTGVTSFSFATDKSAHGIASDQSDKLNAWTWDDLGSFEYYIKAQAGFTLEIRYVALRVTNIEVVAPWAVRPHRTRRTG